MNEFEQLIIEFFDSKNENFRKGMAKEFKKREPNVATPDLYKYRELLIYDILKEISAKNDKLLIGINNPLALIETILFNHIIKK
jgi:hypothetical protein